MPPPLPVTVVQNAVQRQKTYLVYKSNARYAFLPLDSEPPRDVSLPLDAPSVGCTSARRTLRPGPACLAGCGPLPVSVPPLVYVCVYVCGPAHRSAGGGGGSARRAASAACVHISDRAHVTVTMYLCFAGHLSFRCARRSDRVPDDAQRRSYSHSVWAVKFG